MALPLGTVDRVVLDSMYVRQASLEHLEALRARGFRISIPELVLQEVYANAARAAAAGEPIERARGRLASPLGRLAPFVDRELPIAPAGRALTSFIRPRNAADRGERDKRIALLQRLWVNLASGIIADAHWLEAGVKANEELNSDGDKWIERVRQSLGTAPELRILPDRQAAAIARPIIDWRKESSRYRDRFDAFSLVFALRAVYIVRSKPGEIKKPDQNDEIDHRLLMLVGLPAFFATNDKTLRKHVAACGAYQAPWVRTIEELLEGDLPLGLPWGPSARKLRA